MTEKIKDLIVGIASGLIGGSLAGIMAGLLGMNLISLGFLTLFLTGAVFAVIRLMISVWKSK